MKKNTLDLVCSCRHLCWSFSPEIDVVTNIKTWYPMVSKFMGKKTWSCIQVNIVYAYHAAGVTFYLHKQEDTNTV
jgi:hypothetical protein